MALRDGEGCFLPDLSCSRGLFQLSSRIAWTWPSVATMEMQQICRITKSDVSTAPQKEHVQQLEVCSTAAEAGKGKGKGGGG